jgi:hypothetical protein
MIIFILPLRQTGISPSKAHPKRSGPDRAAQGCDYREDDEKIVRSTDFSAS